MAYLCEACGKNSDSRSNFKHKKGCKERFKIAKVCMKSGTSPHVSKKTAKVLVKAAIKKAKMDAIAAATSNKPINATCPVKKGRAIDEDLTIKFGGKVIGFC